MNDYKCIKYNELYVGCLSYVEGEPFHLSIAKEYRKYRNKIACYDKGSSAYSPAGYLMTVIRHTIDKGRSVNKIFIAKGCRVPKDIYRNTGYILTTDMSKADTIVVPSPLKFTIHYFDIAAMKEDNLLLLSFSINRRHSNKDAMLREKYFGQAKDYLARCGYSVLHDSPYFMKYCTMFEPHDIYKDIFDGKYIASDKLLLDELAVKVRPPVKINLDTLELWKSYTSTPILIQSICASNWQDYPVTLCVFLHEEVNIGTSNVPQPFKLILEQIGYTSTSTFKDDLRDREIQPDDWNLLQSYIMRKLGVDANGGYISPSRFGYSNLPDIIRKKYLVAPKKISHPTLFENIIASL